ncbi:MAG: SBBP repeat-containing protein [Chloroflexi bacterium]|nr:SBBP repeat-containing protein [Chloroflexota bacterium]
MDKSLSRWVLLMTLALLVFVVPLQGGVAAGDEPATLWTRQFGTSGSDYVTGIAAGGSGVTYVVGSTTGVFPGESLQGFLGDAFIRRYDSAGVHQWTRQFGGIATSGASGVVIDGLSNAYVVGNTAPSLPGQTGLGGLDGFIRKYNTAGQEVWTRQFGTGDHDYARGVALDGDSVYVVGDTGFVSYGVAEYDSFIRKYDLSGAGFWEFRFAADKDNWAFAVTADGQGGIYVVGDTFDGFGQGDVKGGYLRKFNRAGFPIWTRIFGGVSTHPRAVAADSSGNAYVAGYATDGGGIDVAFIWKFGPLGEELWSRQFGTGAGATISGVTVDASSVWVVGSATGALLWQTAHLGLDAFIRRYDSGGNELWTRQFGTDSDDVARAVSYNGSGRVHVVGETDGLLPEQNSAGGRDGFIMKLGDPSEPDPTPTPTPGPVPLPTLTPTPSATPTLTLTVTPTPTPAAMPTPTPAPTPGFLLGDINRDGVVNNTDLALLGVSFNLRAGDAGYNANADFNRDGIVDVYDLVVVGMNFGRTL